MSFSPSESIHLSGSKTSGLITPKVVRLKTNQHYPRDFLGSHLIGYQFYSLVPRIMYSDYGREDLHQLLVYDSGPIL